MKPTARQKKALHLKWRLVSLHKKTRRKISLGKKAGLNLMNNFRLKKTNWPCRLKPTATSIKQHKKSSRGLKSSATIKIFYGPMVLN